MFPVSGFGHSRAMLPTWRALATRLTAATDDPTRHTAAHCTYDAEPTTSKPHIDRAAERRRAAREPSDGLKIAVKRVAARVDVSRPRTASRGRLTRCAARPTTPAEDPAAISPCPRPPASARVVISSAFDQVATVSEGAWREAATGAGKGGRRRTYRYAHDEPKLRRRGSCPGSIPAGKRERWVDR